MTRIWDRHTTTHIGLTFVGWAYCYTTQPDPAEKACLQCAAIRVRTCQCFTVHANGSQKHVLCCRHIVKGQWSMLLTFCIRWVSMRSRQAPVAPLHALNTISPYASSTDLRPDTIWLSITAVSSYTILGCAHQGRCCQGRKSAMTQMHV